MSPSRVKGIVKWYCDHKGYGMVECCHGTLFCHYSYVQGNGYKTLKAGEEIEFDVSPGLRGLEARNIKKEIQSDSN